MHHPTFRECTMDSYSESQMEISYATNVKPVRVSLDPRDPSSRYKTRQLQIYTIGKNKMVRTVLLNVTDVAKDMRVPSDYIVKFLGYELYARTSENAINGDHSPQEISKVMLKFLNEIVLCDRCGLPEVSIDVVSAEKTKRRCHACGQYGTLKLSNPKFFKYVQGHPNILVEKWTHKPLHEFKPHEHPLESLKESDVVWFSDTSEKAVEERRQTSLPQNADLFQSM